MTKPGHQLFTVKTFAATFGYNESYVRQMVIGLPDFRTGIPLHLPAGWSAQKLGRDWIITPDSPKEVTRLLRERKESIAQRKKVRRRSGK